MHPRVDTGANLKQALRGAAPIIEQNDEIGLLREFDCSLLARVRVAAHRLNDLDRGFGTKMTQSPHPVPSAVSSMFI